MSHPTEQQNAAIRARGNVLVAAGAGTGKTSTVTDRCLELILHERIAGGRCGLDQILMVTFTEAAAAEMRQRLRTRLREAAEALNHSVHSAPQSLAADLSAPPDDGDARHLAEQLALLDTANISTLHGFCLELVRRNFHTLGLDPACVVLDETQTRPLIHTLLNDLFLKHYAGTTDYSAQVRELIRSYGRGRDQKIREWIVKIHRYSQTLPSPDAWFSAQTTLFSAAEPTAWRHQFSAAVSAWARLWQPPLAASADACSNLATCQVALNPLIRDDPTLAQIASALAAINDADETWKRGTKKLHRDPIKRFFEDARFLSALAKDDGAALVEDWNWARQPMLVLLRLAEEFGQLFAQAKRELGGIDFSDQEQFALRLLRTDAGAPTQIARACREQFAFVFVDECQDINAAQAAIIQAVSGEDACANRFLVGDVKQSIYRFRLADPRIFQSYQAAWATPQTGKARSPLPVSDALGVTRPTNPGQVLALTENFRSAEGLLNFVNSVFGVLMRPAIGGLTYGAEAQLHFGAAATRAALAVNQDSSPRVELHVLTKDDFSSGNLDLDGSHEATPNAEDLLAVEREARLIAAQFKALKTSHYPVADTRDGQLGFRPVEYSDMVVLLRAAAGKTEMFAKAFHQFGIPLQAERAGFLEAQEIADGLNLLRLLDNPLQDLPLLGVLRSPFVGLSAEELAQLRIAEPKGRLWIATQKVLAPDRPLTTALRDKLAAFHQRFRRWRELIRHAPLTHCLETILLDTHYETLLLTSERGPERVANVRRLIELARRFDPYQREGLFRFLRFIADQEVAEVDHSPAEVAPENAVRLLTIHASKGLEFPIVAVAGLGSRFNTGDLNDDILLSETIGLAPKIVPPHARSKYPSFAHWHANQYEHRAMWGEELRLLYVALTRARDRLLLVGSTARRDEIERWHIPAQLTDHARLKANSFLAWLHLWFTNHTAPDEWQQETSGQNRLLAWRFHGAQETPASPTATEATELNAAETKPGIEPFAEIQTRIHFQYPHLQATVEPAKTTVTAIRRRIADDTDEESRKFFPPETARLKSSSADGLSAAEIGIAHHTFQQFITIARTATDLDLRNEAERLRGAGVLSEEQFAVLDFGALGSFWHSDLGAKLRALPAGIINREMPFTARLDPKTLRTLKVLQPAATLAADDFIVVQGQVDLAVLLPDEIWLLDFKTDAVDEAGLPDKLKQYAPQLEVYATALEQIYHRPVTNCWLHFLRARKTVEL
ncbi:MAG: UvrD-helicase domain-containing protein [Verrucomicrobiae bacterium]|nr:UvrD-helicase domain-containing protein [Verrucomicrobiae bacterium]